MLPLRIEQKVEVAKVAFSFGIIVLNLSLILEKNTRGSFAQYYSSNEQQSFRRHRLSACLEGQMVVSHSPRAPL